MKNWVQRRDHPIQRSGRDLADEFKHFIGKDMRLEQVSLRKTDLVKELLEFYMGKNTMERQNFIINNLVIEEDLAS
ncbi:DNA topoisomerase IV subunit B [human gut metagenome]|uniref:DNA topoisomerase IV subunit B n=1 Tax=human gut metagenome TaxID=408170 RepID=K1TM81_9ZZZZ